MGRFSRSAVLHLGLSRSADRALFYDGSLTGVRKSEKKLEANCIMCLVIIVA